MERTLDGAVANPRWGCAISEALQPSDLEIMGWGSSVINPRNPKEIQLFDVTLGSSGIVVGRVPRIDLNVSDLTSAFREKLEDAARFKAALVISGEYSKENTYDQRSIGKEATPSDP